jgi:hypothetical protein
MSLTLTTVVSGFNITPTNAYANLTPVEFNIVYAGALLSFNAIWLFGDGEYAITTVPNITHTYTAPGNYNTALIVFNTIEEVKNYLVQHNLSLGLLPTTQEYLTYTQTLSVTNAIIDNINLVNVQAPVLQSRQAITPYRIGFESSHNTIPNITLYSSGSLSQPWEVVDTKWGHLKPRWRFVDINGNNISTITPELTSLNTLIYVGGALSAVPFDTTLPSTEVAGVSGFVDFFYIDDIPATVLLHATLDTSNYDNPRDRQYVAGIPAYANSTLTVETSCTIYGSSPAQLVITSNGLNSFTLEGTKWQKALVPYVISVADSAGYMLRNFPVSNTSGNTYPITRYLAGVNSAATIFELPVANFNRYDDNSADIGGYYTGFFQSLSTIDNTMLCATCTVETSAGTVTLAGSSVPFDILSYDAFYGIRKFNEDFDMASTIKSYALQETIADSTVLFDDIIGQIVGDSTSSPNDMGKSIYEKISNYVDNHSNIDACNIDKLYSLCQKLDIPIENYNFDYPTNIKRIMNILSIAYGRLKGGRNLYDRDFQPSTTVAARQNLGNRLNTETYALTAGTKVVISERHSNQYEIFNVMPVGVENVYPVRELSAFNYKTPFDLYYKLYDYVPFFDNTQLDGIISWDDTYTTLNETISSIDVWLGDFGTVETILDYELRRGLELINN